MGAVSEIGVKGGRSYELMFRLGLSGLSAEYMVSFVPTGKDAEDLWKIQGKSRRHKPRLNAKERTVVGGGGSCRLGNLTTESTEGAERGQKIRMGLKTQKIPLCETLRSLR